MKDEPESKTFEPVTINSEQSTISVNTCNRTHNLTYHLRAILMGVVRQDVKRSAGSSGFIGNNSLAPQEANCMQFLTESVGGMLPFEAYLCPFIAPNYG